MPLNFVPFETYETQEPVGNPVDRAYSEIGTENEWKG